MVLRLPGTHTRRPYTTVQFEVVHKNGVVSRTERCANTMTSNSPFAISDQYNISEFHPCDPTATQRPKLCPHTR